MPAWHCLFIGGIYFEAWSSEEQLAQLRVWDIIVEELQCPSLVLFSVRCLLLTVCNSPLQVRKAFKAEEGNTLVVADYGQLELRLLAHMAGCASMLEAFRLGGDFHSRTALGMYDHIKSAIDRGMLLHFGYHISQLCMQTFSLVTECGIVSIGHCVRQKHKAS